MCFALFFARQKLPPHRLAMSSLQLEIVTDSSVTDCFLRVPSAFIADTVTPFFFGSPPAVAPVELRCSGHRYFVGVLSGGGRRTATISPMFAQQLGIADGSDVRLRPVRAIDAVHVHVEPATVDDSEVIELNQRTIEDGLLRTISVVYPGLVVPIAVHGGVAAHIRFGDVSPVTSDTAPCALLSPGTELFVATRPRVDASRAGAALPAVLHVEAAPQSLRSILPTPTAATPVLLLCSEATAATQRWTDGMTLALLDMAIVAAALLECNAATGKPGDAAQTATAFAVESPALQRQALRVAVRVFPTAPDTSSWCYVHSLEGVASLTLPTRAVAFTTVADQAARAGGGAKQAPQLDGAADRLELLSEVHGSVVRELAAQLAVDARNSDVRYAERAPRVLLTGGHGCGKSSVAAAVAACSGRHVVPVRCTANGNQTVERLARGFLEAALCGPSVVVIDDLGAFVPAQPEGQPAGPTGLGNATALCSYLTSATQRGSDGLDVAVIATAQSRESIHAHVLASPTHFSTVAKIAPLSLETRLTLMGQLVPHIDRAALEPLSAKFENYVAYDLIQLHRKAATHCQQRHSSTEAVSIDDITAVAATYRPLAHTGISLMATNPAAPVTWANLGGLAAAKKTLYDAIVLPSKFPQLFASLPLKTRSGVLLYGPPGCGKSHVLSVLVAAEHLNCIVVNGPEILDKYIGASEQKVREVFEKAQAASPCVLFFDEFDSIAPQRGNDNTGVTDRVVNQLLCYLDGVEGRKNVFVVAASSRPDLIDTALLRPGRLDKMVLCGMPTADERVDILQSHCALLTLARGVDVAEVAGWCNGWTGADLAGLATSANLRAVTRVLDKAKAAGTAAALQGAETTGGAAAASINVPADAVDRILSAVAETHRRGGNPLYESHGNAMVHARDSKVDVVEENDGDGDEAVTIEDFRAALASTRRSLTDGDLATCMRHYAGFGVGDKKKKVAAGTVTTMA
jgi:SpoVK/Ycf46/Vps4 family AAA+-type ATPase